MQETPASKARKQTPSEADYIHLVLYPILFSVLSYVVCMTAAGRMQLNGINEK